MGPKKKKGAEKGKRQERNEVVVNKKAQVKPSTENPNRVVKVETAQVVEEKVVDQPRTRADEVDKPVAHTEQPSAFNKRPIVSNWRKYELPEDEIKDLDEPKSINSLLGNKCGVGFGGRFRFSDEREWEESNFAEDSINEFYSLDVKHLVKSLLCVPLYDRLFIDKEYFDHDTALQMENDAKRAFRNYDRPQLNVQKSTISSKLDSIEHSRKFIAVKVNDVKSETKIADLIPQQPPTPNAMADLPSESINQLEFELDALLNLSTSQQRHFSDNDDFPVVSFD